MEKITKSDIHLATIIRNGTVEKGLQFYSNDSDYIQVGSWRYESGKKLLAHVHNEVERKVLRTQEVILVQKGHIQAHIYDESGEHVTDKDLKSGDCIILLAGGHGYTIVEDDSVVIEVKNGPYVGAELDRRRL